MLLRERAGDADAHAELVDVAESLEHVVVLVSSLHVEQARRTQIPGLGVELELALAARVDLGGRSGVRGRGRLVLELSRAHDVSHRASMCAQPRERYLRKRLNAREEVLF